MSDHLWSAIFSVMVYCFEALVECDFILEAVWSKSLLASNPKGLKKIKAMLGMLGDGENICGCLFMMELLPLGYHCMRTWQSLYQPDCWTPWNTNGMLIFFCSRRAWNATIGYLLPPSLPLSMENIANFEKFKQKTRHKYKKYCSS